MGLLICLRFIFDYVRAIADSRPNSSRLVIVIEAYKDIYKQDKGSVILI